MERRALSQKGLSNAVLYPTYILHPVMPLYVWRLWRRYDAGKSHSSGNHITSTNSVRKQRWQPDDTALSRPSCLASNVTDWNSTPIRRRCEVSAKFRPCSESTSSLPLTQRTMKHLNRTILPTGYCKTNFNQKIFRRRFNFRLISCTYICEEFH